MLCPNCGTENPDGAKFCVMCGARVIAEAGESPREQPAPSTGPRPSAGARQTQRLAQVSGEAGDSAQFILGIFSCALVVVHAVMAILLAAIPEEADWGYFIGLFLMQVGVGVLGAAVGIAGSAIASARFRVMCLSGAALNILILLVAAIVIAAVAD